MQYTYAALANNAHCTCSCRRVLPRTTRIDVADKYTDSMLKCVDGNPQQPACS